MDGGDGQSYYDISLVDGYNLPIAIVLQGGSNSSFQGIPPNATNPSCVASLGNLNPDTNYWPYTYDDKTSTFIVPAGAGFEVIFCPGARSTNILSAESSLHSQIAGSGHANQGAGEIGETADSTLNASISSWAVGFAIVAALVTGALFSSL
ncbi:MAG: hypothetical protein Q9157_008776 [Trypethelium eluteriae]